MKNFELLVITSRFMAKHKIAWSDFEQALLGPKGEGHDCMDAEGRATQDAVAEEARSNLQKSAIRHEITAVTLFPRNDRLLLYLNDQAHHPKGICGVAFENEPLADLPESSQPVVVGLIVDGLWKI